MTRNQKISAASASVLFSLIVIASLYKYFTLKSSLQECSLFTVAKIEDIYKLRRGTRVQYKYKINSEVVENKESVGPDDSKEFLWSVDMEKLRNRNGLIVQVYCHDLRKHKILWHIKVPDTLTYIPSNGWKEIPYGLAKTEE